MKIVLSADEVRRYVLDRLNTDIKADFDVVTFDGYSQFTSATVTTSQPTVAAASPVQPLVEAL